MTARARDLLLSAGCLAVSGYIWGETAAYPKPAGEAMVEGLGPAFYPRVLAVVLAGLAGLVAVATLARGGGAGAATAAPGERGPEAAPGPGEPGAAAARPALWRAAALLGMLVAYRYLMPILGFPLATFAFLVAAMLFLAPPARRARPATLGIIAGCSVLATAVVFLLFTRVVKVAVPAGLLFGH